MSEYDNFARFYDLEYQRYTDDLDFYLNMARRTESPILELACGTGRVLLPLARAGHRVTGLDISQPMLAIAQEKVAAEPPAVQQRISLILADMRRFRIPERFRLAFYAINSFMHLMTRSDQTRSLRCVRRHLADDGLLIVDLFNPDLALFDSNGHLFYDRTLTDPKTGTIITKMVSTRVDRANQVNYITFFYDELGPENQVQRTVATISQRYLYRYEMEYLLERCGFALEHLYGSYDLDEFTFESPKMIFVARPK